ELQIVGEADHLAVYAGTDEAVPQHILEQVLVLALLPADHRGQHQEARPLRQRQDAGQDLLPRLRRDRPTALRAMALADTREQDAQIVVNLSDGADGRARVAGRRLLLDADRRRQPPEVIDVGLLHLPQELPRVARQRLDVAALPLGVERVEGQGTFAGAADAGEDNQLVARQFEADVAKVMLARSAHDDGVVVHYSGVLAYQA